DTWNWLKARGCEKQVNPQLLEEYAMSVSRWIQCEEAISEFGFLAKHPTTGMATTSPYVAMAQNFQKQMNNAWFQIYQIVKDNCSVDYSGPNPQDNVMEMLLSRKS
ncbi:MAG: P27 family phage terminase small subunit, partial [Erysipelotrichaceae bacterium]|nr:P27 family phage terminase small subunit [Erysipelotrichaceae bacterium]